MANNTNKREFTTLSILFFLISFLGWGLETVVCYVESGRFCDRGFLTLPFCPIYGGAMCLIYLLLGRPSDGFFYRIFQTKKTKSRGHGREFVKFWAVIAYFVSATFLASLVELVVGLIVESVGLSLWSYHGLPFCFLDLVCLPVSLAWGALVSVFAQFILPCMERVVGKISKRVREFLTCMLWTAVMADYLYNVVRYFS